MWVILTRTFTASSSSEQGHFLTGEFLAIQWDSWRELCYLNSHALRHWMLSSWGQEYILWCYSLSLPLQCTTKGCWTKESNNWHRLLLLLHMGRRKADSHMWGIRAPFLLCDLTNHISNRFAEVRALQTLVFYEVPVKVLFCQCKNKADFIYRVQWATAEFCSFSTSFPNRSSYLNWELRWLCLHPSHFRPVWQ